LINSDNRKCDTSDPTQTNACVSWAVDRAATLVEYAMLPSCTIADDTILVFDKKWALTRPLWDPLRADIYCRLTDRSRREMIIAMDAVEDSPYTVGDTILAKLATWTSSGLIAPGNNTANFTTAAEALRVSALPACSNSDTEWIPQGECGADSNQVLIAVWQPGMGPGLTCQMLLKTAAGDTAKADCDIVEWSSGRGIATAILASLVLFGQLSAGIMTYRRRDTPALRAAAWRWTLVMLLGLALLAAATLTDAGPATAGKCGISIALAGTGVAVLLSAVVVKLGRVSLIFNQNTIKAVSLPDVRLIPRFLIMLIPHFILLIALFAKYGPAGDGADSDLGSALIGRNIVVFDKVGSRQYTECAYEAATPIFAVWLAYALILLCIAIRMTAKAVGVGDTFGENRALLLLCALFAVLVVVFVPSAALLRTRQMLLVKLAVFLFFSGSMTIVLFAPKLFSWAQGDSLTTGLGTSINNNYSVENSGSNGSGGRGTNNSGTRERLQAQLFARQGGGGDSGRGDSGREGQPPGVVIHGTGNGSPASMPDRWAAQPTTPSHLANAKTSGLGNDNVQVINGSPGRASGARHVHIPSQMDRTDSSLALGTAPAGGFTSPSSRTNINTPQHASINMVAVSANNTSSNNLQITAA
jgi:hypothetical protein